MADCGRCCFVMPRDSRSTSPDCRRRWRERRERLWMKCMEREVAAMRIRMMPRTMSRKPQSVGRLDDSAEPKEAYSRM